MKKAFAFTIIGLLAASAAFAALGDVVNSFPAPGSSSCAVARSTNYLYVFSASTGYIYRMNPASGSVYNSYSAVNGTSMRGLAYVATGYLYQAKSNTPPYIYRTNEANGSIYSSFSSPGIQNRGLAPLCTGDGGTGTTALLSPNYSSRVLYHLNITNGSVISTYQLSNSMYDPGYDHRNQLIWGGMNGTAIYGFATTGSLVASFTSPGGSPYGMAYYGEYLYVATLSGWVYQVHCPASSTVAPASLGRVKALFR